MQKPDDDVTAHVCRFEAMLDGAFRSHGGDGLPGPLREAVRATPRHRFVHRFRLQDGRLQDNDAGSASLATIYSDEVLEHVGAAGERLPSTHSQPSYVLWLLSLLDLRPGLNVLEIGSGSGWLAAIMGRLVGPAGRVTGVEIIAELAAQSRADLAAVGLSNVEILARDGAQSVPEGAPFGRVMITAGIWDFPAFLFETMVEGGLVLAPIELRGGDLCHVAVLQRAGDRFTSERGVPGAFVPLLGAGQRRGVCRRGLAGVAFWPDMAAGPIRRRALPPGADAGKAAAIARDFRAFLSRTEPGFAIFVDAARGCGGLAEPFGILDEAEHSVALWHGHEMIGYGNGHAWERLAGSYAAWTACGMPGLGAFGLEIVRHGTAIGSGRLWVEPRHETALLWRLPTADTPAS